VFLTDHHGLKLVPFVDPTDARKATVRRFGRSDRRALARFGPMAIRRGDKRPLELFLAGIRGWNEGLRRRIYDGKFTSE
jgi:hypothetical protein